MITWKYTDNRNIIVFRVNENGNMESCLVDEIAEWIAAGNIPLPADDVPQI